MSILRVTPGFFTSVRESCQMVGAEPNHLYVQAPNLYHYNMLKAPYGFTCDVVGKIFYEVSIDMRVREEMSPPFVGGQFHDELDPIGIDQFRHNLVSWSCVDGTSEIRTDVPLSKLASIGNGDAFSPDFMFDFGDRFVVVEVKTIAMGDPTNVYENAILKYEDPLGERAKLQEHPKPMFFFVLVASNDRVLTNLILSDDVIHKIRTSMVIGDAIKRRAIKVGWESLKDDRFKENKIRLERAIRNAASEQYIPADASPPMIDRKMIAGWNEPLDKEVVQALVRKNYDLAIDALIEGRKKKDSIHQVEAFQHRVNTEDSRTSMKTPFQLPMILPKTTLPSKFEISEFYSESTYLSRMWSTAVRRMFGEEASNFTESDLLEQLRVALNPQEKTEKTKKMWHRVMIKMLDSDTLEAAMQGIEGKKYKGVAAVQEKKAENKKHFSLKTNTNDIEELFGAFDLLEMTNLGMDYESITKSLRTRESDVMGNFESQNLSLDFLRKFGSTKMGLSLSVLESVLQEVNLSLNQFCKPGQFILKKCLHHDVWILLKATKAGSVIFFSVLVPKDRYQLLHKSFKKPHLETSTCYLFDFISVNRDKLAHFLSGMEKSACLYAMWAELFHNEPNTSLRKNDSRVFKHWMCSQLVMLEAKTQTSTNIQLARYAYMECIRLSALRQDPLKILTKLDERPRSRLLVWFYKRFIKAFSMMQQMRPRILADDASRKEELSSADVFEDLISYVDMEPSPTFELVLNLCYLGTLHNRDESDMMHAALAIFEKIIKEEKEMRGKDRDLMGRRDHPDHVYRDHELSVTFIRFAGDMTFETLQNNYGGYYRKRIKERVHNESVHKTWETLSTFKSSAYFEGDLSTWNESESGNKRRRVMEGMIELMKTTPGVTQNPFESIDVLLNRLEAEGGVRAQLFKKSQIGGVREIFILSALGRVVINFLETICRIIDEDLPMEMLTKGDLKLAKSDAHYSEVFATMKLKNMRFKLTCIDSDDATTWCQRFVMPAFGALLQRLLPKKLFLICARILNCVTLKEIEVPDIIFEKFSKNAATDSHSEQVNELKSQWRTWEGPHDIIDYQGRFVHNRSNFMQGILHYTSSLMHASYMVYHEFICRELFKKYKALGYMRQTDELRITTKESSDDSAAIRTIISEEEMDEKYVVTLTIMSLLKKTGYSFWTAKQSEEKSTSACFSGVEEFNSFWTINNTLMTPLIKFVYAGQGVKVITRMDSRQTVMADLRKQIVENGGSIFLASLAQECHFRTHYYTLGSITNKLFPFYRDALLEIPHPAVGYFIFEPHSLCGIFGYDFASYLHILKDARMNSCEWSLYKRGGFDVSETGRPTLSLLFHTGKSKRYKEFMTRLNADPRWRLYFEQFPELLYEKSRTLDESYLKILKKAHNPSASEAFSFQAGSKVYSASVYILNTRCVTVIDKTLPEDSKRYMTSLLRAMHSFYEDITDEILTPSLILTLFPSYSVYDEALENLRNIKNAVLIKKSVRKPKRMVILTSPKIHRVASVSLLDVVRRHWWDVKIKSSNTEFYNALANYTRIFPWIKKTPGETLFNSPFDTHIALADFIIGQGAGKRSFKILGPIRRNLPTASQIHQIIKKCYMQGHIVSGLANPEPSSRALAPKLISELLLASKVPSAGDSTIFVRQILETSKPLVTNSDDMAIELSLMGRQEAVLSIIQGFVQKRIKLENALPLIRHGTVGYFDNPQKFSSELGKYVGKGNFYGQMEGTTFRLSINDGMCDLIEVVTLRNVKKIVPSLNLLLEEIHCEAVSNSHMRGLFLDLRTEQVSKVPTSNCIRVEENSKLRPFEITSLRLKLELTRSGHIKLVEKGEVPHTVLRLKLSEWKWDSKYVSREPKSNNVFEYWMSYNSIPHAVVTNYIESLREDLEDSGGRLGSKKKRSNMFIKQLEAQKDWLRSTLISRLGFIADVHYEDRFEAEPEPDVTLEEAQDVMDFLMDFATEEQMVHEVEEEEEEEQQEFTSWADYEESNITNIDIDNILKMTGFMDRGVRLSETTHITVENFHPFWDRFISTLTSEGVQLQRLVFTNDQFDETTRDLKLLGWLLNNKEREPKVVLIENRIASSSEDILGVTMEQLLASIEKQSMKKEKKKSKGKEKVKEGEELNDTEDSRITYALEDNDEIDE